MCAKQKLNYKKNKKKVFRFDDRNSVENKPEMVPP